MHFSELSYRTLKKNLSSQQARVVLPNSTSTKLIITANLREWIYIIKLRTEKGVYPPMIDLMNRIKSSFKSQSKYTQMDPISYFLED